MKLAEGIWRSRLPSRRSAGPEQPRRYRRFRSTDAGGGKRGRVHGPYKHEKAGQEPGSRNNTFQNSQFAGKGSGLSGNYEFVNTRDLGSRMGRLQPIMALASA